MKHIQQAGMNHASPFYGGGYILPHKEKALKSLNFRAFSLFAFLNRRCVRKMNLNSIHHVLNILASPLFFLPLITPRVQFFRLLGVAVVV